jgi:type IV pilus assembly protein PilC
MATYTYKARNNTGQLVTGNITANSEQEVIVQLRQMQYAPVKISQGVTANIYEDAAAKTSFFSLIFSSKKIKVRDMAIFCTNLSSMTSAGVPLLGALNMVSDQLTSVKLSATIRKISQRISDGASFSEALAAFGDIFSSFFINMIRAAEMSGTLDQVLKDMAVYMEKQDTLRQTVRGMMIYPIILAVACLGVITLIITFVMPQFVHIFTKAGVPLPAPTKMLYEIGLWIKQYPMFYVPALVACVFLFRKFLKTKQGKDVVDRMLLKVPKVGALMKNSLVARFCRTLATMLNTGVPMLQSLRIVQQVLGNVVFTEIVQDVYESVEKGEGIHQALFKHREFPKDVVYMISVGEKSGNIGMMLNKIADFYESKVQFEVKELVVLIEPAFIVMMAVSVGGILASVILPMFDMIKTIQR